MITWTKDQLRVKIYETNLEMGHAAAKDIAAAINRCIREKGEANVIFAAAPSQNTTLSALLAEPVDWGCVNAFHMDEYIGLPPDSENTFRHYLKTHFFENVSFRSVHYISSDAEDIGAECARYASLLERYPTDVVCLGIGENGHIAFNDPPVADFDDPLRVKAVELEIRCRIQQVHDGCFPSLEYVPTHAITLTIPALTAATAMFCVVPGTTKANAIYELLTGPIGEHCPATALRYHSGAILYCDKESAGKLEL
ncbi:MAG: glucosamine-6-phosphate deaminase [Clostridia bacterium]|nr:glucosamine-6-phosphate deaminase [Clostridia bacterium]